MAANRNPSRNTAQRRSTLVAANTNLRLPGGRPRPKRNAGNLRVLLGATGITVAILFAAFAAIGLLIGARMPEPPQLRIADLPQTPPAPVPAAPVTPQKAVKAAKKKQIKSAPMTDLEIVGAIPAPPPQQPLSLPEPEPDSQAQTIIPRTPPPEPVTPPKAEPEIAGMPETKVPPEVQPLPPARVEEPPPPAVAEPEAPRAAASQEPEEADPEPTAALPDPEPVVTPPVRQVRPQRAAPPRVYRKKKVRPRYYRRAVPQKKKAEPPSQNPFVRLFGG
jgi:hypothetical protein